MERSKSKTHKKASVQFLKTPNQKPYLANLDVDEKPQMVVLVLSTPNVDEHRERERNSSARGGNKNLAVCCDVLWCVLWCGVRFVVCLNVREAFCLSSDYSFFPPQHRTVSYRTVPPPRTHIALI